jgi:hypothetical protein
MIKLSIIIILILLSSCEKTIDIDYIKKHEWKYGSGDGWAGDWLSFNNNSRYKLNRDTLFERDTARAIIISLDKNSFDDDNEMKIKIIKTGKLGTYHEK